MKLTPGKIRNMQALSNERGVIAAAAMDQRGSLLKSIAASKGIDADQVTDQMMEEFKTAVSKVLTPHASAILLDPEWGLQAAKLREKNAGLLLAYEKSGYDNTQPGRRADLLPDVSVHRLARMGANAVKVLIYYTPFEAADVNEEKHAFIERIGDECRANDLPFFLEFVGYDPAGGDEKGLEYAKKKPEIVSASMAEFSKDQYGVDVLKVEIPVNLTPRPALWRSFARPPRPPRGHLSTSVPASATSSSPNRCAGRVNPVSASRACCAAGPPGKKASPFTASRASRLSRIGSARRASRISRQSTPASAQPSLGTPSMAPTAPKNWRPSSNIVNSGRRWWRSFVPWPVADAHAKVAADFTTRG
jgi:tagatose-1,6-bisphosphate aldolase